MKFRHNWLNPPVSPYATSFRGRVWPPLWSTRHALTLNSAPHKRIPDPKRTHTRVAQQQAVPNLPVMVPVATYPLPVGVSNVERGNMLVAMGEE